MAAFRMLAGQHEAEIASQGVSDEVGRVANLAGDEVLQLRHEMGPVLGDRIARVVTILLDGMNGVALCLPALE